MAIVAAVLDGQVADEDRYLLQDDLKKFQVYHLPRTEQLSQANATKDNVKQINAALAKILQQDASVLVNIIATDDKTASKHLSTTIKALKSSVSTDQAKLHDSRLVLAQEASRLHELHRQVIERSIRILEQTIHGSVARGVKAKADYLAMVAEGMNKKIELQRGQLLSQLFTPAFQEALQTKLDELQEANRLAKRKVREAEERLEDYEKVQGMSNLAQEYAEVLKETDKVRSEIARLEKGRE